MATDLHAALGELIVSFSRLEACAAYGICEFFPSGEYKKIEVIAFELPFRKRLDVLVALAKAYPLDTYYLEALVTAVATASSIEEKRNETVHSHWEATIQVKSNIRVMGIRRTRVKVQRKKGMIRTSELPSIEEISALALEAIRAADSLHLAANEAAAYCKPSQG